MKRATLAISLFFLFLSLVPRAYCSDVSITDVPQKMGEALGIPEPNTALVGGVVMSTIFFMAVVMPTLFIRNKAVAFILAFLALGIDVAFSWLPPWLMLMICLMVAGLFAKQIKGMFT